MNEEDVRRHIHDACARLYEEQGELIATRTHERTIAAHLAEYLRPMFRRWNIDTDYNREGREGRRKRDARGLLLPDIIIHRRGERLGRNLAAIEIKGHWNREDRRADEERLRRIANEYGYRFLYRLELEPAGADLIPVE